jgi:hypothetical protein
MSKQQTTNIEALKHAVSQLQSLLSLTSGHSIVLSVSQNACPGKPPHVELSFMRCANWKEATETLRTFSRKERTKWVHGSGIDPFTVYQVEEEGIFVKAFAGGLPPTCRLETYTEKVPKTQTVTTDDFVEITRTRVVCGEDKDPQ